MSEEEFEYILAFGDERFCLNDFQDIENLIIEIILETPVKFLNKEYFDLLTDEKHYKFNIDNTEVFKLESSINTNTEQNLIWDKFEVNDGLSRITFHDVKPNRNITVNINYDNIFKDC